MITGVFQDHPEVPLTRSSQAAAKTSCSSAYVSFWRVASRRKSDEKSTVTLDAKVYRLSTVYRAFQVRRGLHYRARRSCLSISLPCRRVVQSQFSPGGASPGSPYLALASSPGHHALYPPPVCVLRPTLVALCTRKAAYALRNLSFLDDSTLPGAQASTAAKLAAAGAAALQKSHDDRHRYENRSRRNVFTQATTLSLSRLAHQDEGRGHICACAPFMWPSGGQHLKLVIVLSTACCKAMHLTRGRCSTQGGGGCRV